MPEKARIFFVEDNDDYRNIAKIFLERAGHQVVLEASSFNEALRLIPELKENGVNIAIVDGNLTEWRNDGEEGKEVAQAIRAQAPGIKIVEHSDGNYGYGDTVFPKRVASGIFKKLAEAITAL